MNRCTLVENESYGWCTSTSPSRSVANTLLGVSPSANAGWVAGTNGGSFSAGPVDAVDLPQRGQVEQAGHLDDVAGIDVELAQQQLEHVLGHVVGDLQAHRRAEPAPRQLPFQRLQQVLVAVLLDLEVGVAGDPERVVLDDLHAGEQHRQVRRDQVLQRQEPHHRRPCPRGGRARRSGRTLSGTLTRAKCWPPSSGSLTVTARFSDRPEM